MYSGMLYGMATSVVNDECLLFRMPVKREFYFIWNNKVSLLLLSVLDKEENLFTNGLPSDSN